MHLFLFISLRLNLSLPFFLPLSYFLYSALFSLFLSPTFDLIFSIYLSISFLRFQFLSTFLSLSLRPFQQVPGAPVQTSTQKDVRPITVSVDVDSALRVIITCANKAYMPSAVTLKSFSNGGRLYQAPSDVPLRKFIALPVTALFPIPSPHIDSADNSLNFFFFISFSLIFYLL